MGNLHFGQCRHTFLLYGPDVIKQESRVDTTAIEAAGDMQVFSRAAPCRAGNTDRITRPDGCSAGYENL